MKILNVIYKGVVLALLLVNCVFIAFVGKSADEVFKYIQGQGEMRIPSHTFLSVPSECRCHITLHKDGSLKCKCTDCPTKDGSTKTVSASIKNYITQQGFKYDKAKGKLEVVDKADLLK